MTTTNNIDPTKTLKLNAIQPYQLGEMESLLISSIYDAALNPQRWRSVLQMIADACSADQCSMFFYDAQCRHRNYAVAAKINAPILNQYLLNFIDIEASDFHKQLRLVSEGDVVTSKDLLNITGKTYDEIVGSEYMDIFLPQLEFQAGIILMHNNMVCSGMGIRSLRGTNALDQDTLLFLKRLSPHMVQAMKIHNHISNIQQANQAIQNALKDIPYGVFLLDENLRVIFSNAEAARILENSAAVDIGRQGKLFLTQENENNQFQKALNDLLKTRHHSPAPNEDINDISAHSTTLMHPLKLTLLPIETVIHNEINKENIAIAIFVNDPNRSNIIPTDYLQQAYSLSSTECTIMQALSNNHHLNAIAAQRNTTVETARGQLKNIMFKTNTHSQAELTRLLMALC